MPRAFLGKRIFVAPRHTAAPEREKRARALARAFLLGEMDVAEFGVTECWVETRGRSVAGLYAVLADPEPSVRRALAEALGNAADAPHDVILALAREPIGVSLPVLARSPRLTDEDLIDCAACGDVAIQTAIGLRKSLSPAVASSLAEIGGRPTAMALAVNAGANLPEFALLRLAERFADDAEVREALLARAWVPASLKERFGLAEAPAGAAVADRARKLPQDEGLSRARAIMTLAASSDAPPRETAALVAYLRVSGLLTPHLALRALLCGEKALFAASLVAMSGFGERRIRIALEAPDSPDFATLYEAAQMPEELFPAFYAALYALNLYVDPEHAPVTGELQPELVEAALQVAQSYDQADMAPTLGLLRRFAVELYGEDFGLAERAETDTPEIKVDLAALERELLAA